MGTRSLTRIFDNDKQIACIYRQHDGYPDGHGKDMADFIQSGTFVNGIPFGIEGRLFNGIGCFAVQLVSYLKGDEAGGVYLYPADAKDRGEEYVYEIHGGNDFSNGGEPKPLTIKCFGVYDNKVLYDGDIAGFATFVVTDHEEDVE